jgi:hypothetical protein
MNEKPNLDELTKTLAVEMTASTGELWRARIEPERWSTQIYCETAVISLGIDGYKAPYFVKAWAGTPAGITALRSENVVRCNSNRTPAAIAADLNRRLVDEAKDYLIRCKQSQAENDREERRENLIKNLLSKYLCRNRCDTFYSADNKIHSLEIRTDYIEMRLTVSPTDAVRICKLLRNT